MISWMSMRRMHVAQMYVMCTGTGNVRDVNCNCRACVGVFVCVCFVRSSSQMHTKKEWSGCVILFARVKNTDDDAGA